MNMSNAIEVTMALAAVVMVTGWLAACWLVKDVLTWQGDEGRDE
jgi:hypothetical protein